MIKRKNVQKDIVEEKTQNKEDNKEIPNPLGTEIIDDLIKYDEETYQIKRPFLKAQFQQCIPNPELKDELISVQLCSLWGLGFANPYDSIEIMKKTEEKRQQRLINQ